MKKVIFIFLAILFLACCSKSDSDKVIVINPEPVKPDIKITTQEELRKRIEEERAKEKAAVEAMKKNAESGVTNTN